MNRINVVTLLYVNTWGICTWEHVVIYILLLKENMEQRRECDLEEIKGNANLENIFSTTC